jgi:hypothetical protein
MLLLQCLLVWSHMGLLLKTMGNFQEAVDVQSVVAKRAYFNSDRAVSLHHAADALFAMNQPSEALRNYRSALTVFPKHLISYLGVVETLMELKTCSKSDWYALLQEMYCCIGRHVIYHASEIPATFASTLNLKANKSCFEIPSAFYFGMFKAAQCVKEHEQAWWLLEQAHIVQKQEKNFCDVAGKVKHIQVNAETIQNVFNAGFWPAGVGHSSAAPVFIVGMMRSGSTLLEHLLDAHSDVVGIGEDSAMNYFLPSLLKDIQESMRPTAQHPHPQNTSANYSKIKQLINDVGDKVLTRMMSKVLDTVAANDSLLDGAGERTVKHPARIIDKMLFNYRNVGLIHLVFPNAVILHTIRDPLDTIFGCYKQKFDDSGK